MRTAKKMTGFVLCLALLASFAACGKTTEDTRTTPEETQITTEAEETTGEETTEAAPDEETTAAEETTTAAEDAADGEETTSAADGETTAAEDKAATTAAQADKAPAAAATAAPATEAPAPAATEAPTEAPAPAANNTASELLFEFGGSGLNIGDSAEAFVGAVPPNSQEAAPSCYGNGEDINYYYNDFTLYVWNENGNFLTYGIDITGAGASTSRGITIGSTAEALTAAYGTGYAEINDDFVYTYGDCNLHFTLADGVVTAISYNKDI